MFQLRDIAANTSACGSFGTTTIPFSSKQERTERARVRASSRDQNDDHGSLLNIASVHFSSKSMFISCRGCRDVYMFVRFANQVWEPLYVGIADDLHTRLTGHERWAEAVKLGATHLVAQGLAALAARQKAEQDLIGYWNPPLNTHHRTDRRQVG
jgi:hypothetical protein